jgi:hypothetical protein
VIFEREGKATMTYLLISLWPWVAAAFGIGVLTGWVSCSRSETH